MAESSRRIRRLELGVTDDDITGLAGLSFAAKMGEFLGVKEIAAHNLKVYQRERDATDIDMLWLATMSLTTGNGRLCDVNALGADDAARVAAGLGDEAIDARRLGEWLKKFDGRSLAELRAVLRAVSSQVAPRLVAHEVERTGRAMVFIDSTDIEVSSDKFEGAALGYVGKLHLKLHIAYIGNMVVGLRLNGGGVSPAHDWLRILKEDVAPLLPEGTPVLLRADNAYYNGELVAFCEERGWDYTISVTHGTYRKPVLGKAKDLPPRAWRKIGKGERAVIVRYRPGKWRRVQSYLVVRRIYDGKQKLAFPRYTIILVSIDDMPLGKLARLHRGKQGQENAHKALLIEMGLHIPPCHKLDANRAFHAIGQLAHTLLLAVQHSLLPKQERKRGLRPLIRYLVRTAGRLTSSGRTQRINFVACSFRMDWIWHAMGRLTQLARLRRLEQLAPAELLARLELLAPT